MPPTKTAKQNCRKMPSSKTAKQKCRKMGECPVYHPSIEEFHDPLLFVQSIASEASEFGICKIVPPLSSSKPSGVFSKKGGFKFGTQLQPLCLGKWKQSSDFITFLDSERRYTFSSFEAVANNEAIRRNGVSGSLPPDHVEEEFWKEIRKGKEESVEYAINVDGSVFSSPPKDPLSSSKWNLKELPRVDGSALRLLEYEIPGVTKPQLYIGMLFSMFAWHVEDNYLYSINYHHFGAPKTWYGVPSSAASQFEKYFRDEVYNPEILFSRSEDGASALLADKTTMHPPSDLLQHGIPVYKAVQMPGEFVITFPRAYHSGFSHGFNCGEAVNFATNDWYPFGMEASQRYALLGMTPIVPYEELLCKQVMLQISQNRSDPDLKVPFVFLLKLHHYARWRIMEIRPSLSLQTESEGTVLCTLCKRDSFVGHYSCKCHADPICLFHESLIRHCPCGSASSLIIRRDMPEMENVAKMFYQDEEVQLEVERQMERVSHLWRSYKINEDGYEPFSEVRHTKKRRTGPVTESIMWRFSKKGNQRRLEVED